MKVKIQVKDVDPLGQKETVDTLIKTFVLPVGKEVAKYINGSRPLEPTS